MKICGLAIVVLLVVGGCGDEQVSSPENSAEDPTVRAAYRRCVEETRVGLLEDNPDVPGELVDLLLEGAAQTCTSTVLTTCERDPNGEACRVVLDVYDPAET